jgi:acetylornithine deacetylase/succinyl-diaminopimelate desuccinylase-like protein
MTPFEYLSKTESKRLDDLKKFLSFPSVSAQPKHKKDVRACAEWLVAHFKKIGFKARLFPTKGHPIVYAEYRAYKNAPTILYYGHYDVQPPEPLELWKSQPFKAEVRSGYLYARGATDDKGQTFTHIKGLEAVLKTEGKLPINVKFLMEGEEETHSVNLPAFIRKNRKMLAADIVVVSDTAQFSKTIPAVTFGLRGVAAAEVFVCGPDRDVHSGSFGGAIANPVNELCKIVAQLHDKNNKVTIPGYYAKVRKVTPWLKKQYRKLPFKEAAYKKSLGVPALHGEKGYSTFERTWDRPTLDVNGMTGGYQARMTFSSGSRSTSKNWRRSPSA